MPERKSHVKSRRGCSNCKARRVKCDESRPVCAACFRRQEKCLYNNPPSQPYNASPSPGDLNGIAQQRQSHIKELELMHQYCISSHETLSMRSPDAHNILVVVPRLGLEHPFLLDGIFAFTSLHLAYLKPSEAQSRLVDATRYQSQALTYCRQQLPVLNAAECQAIFHCSTVLGVLTLAFRTVDPETQSNLRPTGTVYQLAQLWRGSLLIKKTSAELVDADTFNIIFPPPGYHGQNQEMLDPRVEDFLDLLQRRSSTHGYSKPVTPRRDTDTTDLTPSTVFALDHESGSAYPAAITSLREVFAVHRHYPNRILAWLVVVGSAFMEAMYRQEPLASAIVLLWSVTFRELNGMWWATGFQRDLANELAPLVSAMDSEFAELATWATSQT